MNSVQHILDKYYENTDPVPRILDSAFWSDYVQRAELLPRSEQNPGITRASFVEEISDIGGQSSPMARIPGKTQYGDGA